MASYLRNRLFYSRPSSLALILGKLVPQKIKAVIAGDSGIGKSCLLITYHSKTFPDIHSIISFDFLKLDISVDDRSVQMLCFEPCGGERFRRISLVYYRATAVFLICFSLVDHDSYENVRTIWYPQISYVCPNLPIVLVGTKLDLRHDKETIETLKDKNLAPITTIQGLQLAKEIAASSYVECSALFQKGVEDVFHASVRSVPPPDESKRCVLS